MGAQVLAKHSRVRRPLIRSSTHVPDQPIDRLQLLHWTVDLAARTATILAMLAWSFIRFRELIQRVGTRCFNSSCQLRTTMMRGRGRSPGSLVSKKRWPSGVTS
jgi:hypothetical protein